MSEKVVIVRFLDGETEVLEAPEESMICTYKEGTLFVEIQGDYSLDGHAMRQDPGGTETFYYPPHVVKRVNINRKIL